MRLRPVVSCFIPPHDVPTLPTMLVEGDLLLAGNSRGCRSFTNARSIAKTARGQ
ncbi:MAG: hypothetical protein ING75_10700 [Rhodocyclaceae bacterium]|nr:hypothetical protein [Rhodocyclaceae bacterium]